jgi:hypothetical protein
MVRQASTSEAQALGIGLLTLKSENQDGYKL